MVAVLYREAGTDERQTHVAVLGGVSDISKQQSTDISMKQEQIKAEVTATGPSLPAALLLHCRCSFLLADAAYRSYLSNAVGDRCLGHNASEDEQRQPSRSHRSHSQRRHSVTNRVPQLACHVVP